MTFVDPFFKKKKKENMLTSLSDSFPKNSHKQEAHHCYHLLIASSYLLAVETLPCVFLTQLNIKVLSVVLKVPISQPVRVTDMDSYVGADLT